MERYTPGTTVEESAFTSASKDIPPEYFGPREDKPVRVRFIIDEPQHARDISGTNPEEGEVVWQDRNRFDVQARELISEDEIWIHTTDRGGH